MERRRGNWGATIRLAIVVSSIAAVLAVGLEAIGDVSAGALTTTVAVAGFVASWVSTGRSVRPVDAPSRTHRVAVVRVRHHAV